MRTFLGNFIVESDERYLVGHRTIMIDILPEHIRQAGVIVDSLPPIDIPEGHYEKGLYYNPKTGDIWREYEPTPEPELTEIEQLKQSQAEQDALIMQLMLGGALNE